MKRYPILLAAAVFLIAGTFAVAQDVGVDRASVAFSNPSQPGTVTVSIINGSISVRAYNGNQVVVEARIREKLVDEEREPGEKAKGLRLIRVNTPGLSVNENNNNMAVTASTWRQSVDLEIQVPANTSLKLSTMDNGDITVDGVSGEIEADNKNGKIVLTNIAGAAVAHTMNGEVVATFRSVSPDKPMSFSSWNGDIDVTLPAAVKADLKMKTRDGDVYSDFDIQIVPKPKEEKAETSILAVPVPEAATKEMIAASRLAVRLRDAPRGMTIAGVNIDSPAIYGKINGGGPQFQFNTFQGDVLIRKAK